MARTHWSSGIPEPDQIKEAIQTTRANSPACKRYFSFQAFLSTNLGFETATGGQHYLFFLTWDLVWFTTEDIVSIYKSQGTLSVVEG